MEETVEMNQIRQYDEYVGAVNRHPLVSVIDFSRLPPIRFVRIRKLYGFYAVYLRDAKFSELKYGRGYTIIRKAPLFSWLLVRLWVPSLTGNTIR